MQETCQKHLSLSQASITYSMLIIFVIQVFSCQKHKYSIQPKDASVVARYTCYIYSLLANALEVVFSSQEIFFNNDV